MEEQQAKELLRRYREELVTEEEQKIVETWITQELNETAWTIDPAEKVRFGETIKGRIDAAIQIAPKRKLWPRIAAAAAILIVLSAAFYFYPGLYRTGNSINGVYAKNDIPPGSNKATITLGNGKTIVLSGLKTGVVIDAAKLTYNDGTRITSGTPVAGEEVTVATPRGGTYQVNMPDGSKCWLNAASTLKFPAAFTGSASRRVEITGEAYFEVAKDKKHPFIVTSKEQQIEVLGTHFNVSGYQEEGRTKTTLLEGSVHVSLSSGTRAPGQVILKQGQQSVLQGEGLKVTAVNTDDAIAWKEGYFMFNKESLELIMIKIARWYNVNVIYEDPSVKTETFFGRISKYEHVSTILNALQRTNVVVFKIDGNTINVDRKNK